MGANSLKAGDLFFQSWHIWFLATQVPKTIAREVMGVL
jgi:hypothetical protein